MEKFVPIGQKGVQVLKAIVEIWHKKQVKDVLGKYQQEVTDLPGYHLEYILYALGWILEQEDINFAGRPDKKQRELDNINFIRLIAHLRGVNDWQAYEKAIN